MEIRNSARSETNTRNARVDLADDTAYLVSHPTEKATRYTYADGSTAYKKQVLSGLDEPQYEVDDLGHSLAGSLTASAQVAATVRAVDYERSGTVTYDGDKLAVYVANGTDSVDTSGAMFHGETITAFSSTLVLDPETGIVHKLKTTRTTDYLRTDEPATIEQTLRFSAIGSTNVDKPEWVSQAKNNASAN